METLPEAERELRLRSIASIKRLRETTDRPQGGLVLFPKTVFALQIAGTDGYVATRKEEQEFVCLYADGEVANQEAAAIQHDHDADIIVVPVDPVENDFDKAMITLSSGKVHSFSPRQIREWRLNTMLGLR